MAGLEVTRELLDAKSAEAILAIRSAFNKIDGVYAFLASIPVVNGVDPFTRWTITTKTLNPATAPGKFGYTDDEAYLLRFMFSELHGYHNPSLLETSRKLTGLE